MHVRAEIKKEKLSKEYECSASGVGTWKTFLEELQYYSTATIICLTVSLV